jgi:FkbM family methyltransferase
MVIISFHRRSGGFVSYPSYTWLQYMAISPSQARAVTGLYSLTRRSGLLETALGRKLFTSSYFLYKRYLEDPFAALARSRPDLFRGGDILDIGANIGYTAALFARAADADAAVYAFEPEPFNFRLLETCVRDRKLQEKVVPVHSAVGEQSGAIELWINERHHADHRIATDNLRANQMQGEGGYVTVPIVSVDGFLAQKDAPRRVCLIKVDVQGYELSVCRGMAATAAREPQIAVAIEYMPQALEELGYHASSLLDWFGEREFQMYSLGKSGELSRGLSDELAAKGYVDLIFSRTALI